MERLNLRLPDRYVLIVLGGEMVSADLLALLHHGAERTICADSGAEHVRAAGVPADVVIGDLDSVTPETLQYLAASGTQVVRVAEQYSDDFEKALRHVLDGYSGHVRVVGIGGRRLDHLLTNFSGMLRYTDRFESLQAIDDDASHFFLTKERKEIEVQCLVRTLVSLTPFGVAEGVETEGLLYPLNSEALALGAREGLSNVALQARVRIRIDRGALLVSVAHSTSIQP